MVAAVLSTVVLATQCSRAPTAHSSLVHLDLKPTAHSASAPAVVLATTTLVNANVPTALLATIVAAPSVLTIVPVTVDVLVPKTLAHAYATATSPVPTARSVSAHAATIL